MQPNTVDLSLYHEEPGFVCPTEFWPALGYSGNAPLVGIWWDATTDEACWCDGRLTYTGAEPAAYRRLLAHNFPPGHPAHWLLGATGTPATMWLVVERAGGRAWLVAADDAPELLAGGAAEVEDVAADGLGVVPAEPPRPAGRIWRGAWLEPALSPRALAEAGAEGEARYDALAAALERERSPAAVNLGNSSSWRLTC